MHQEAFFRYNNDLSTQREFNGLITTTTDILVKSWGQADYTDVWEAMKAFTNQRTADTVDELWVVEHPPVFTLGQNGDTTHLLNVGNIPVIPVDRGGHVTYHGPGQVVIYLLIDIQRRELAVRPFVTLIEQSMIGLLDSYGIQAKARCDAPGVYVDDEKIASLGLRIRQGRSYHGLAFNVNMDLEPFSRINPCGHSNIRMTQLAKWIPDIQFSVVANQLVERLISALSRSNT